MPIENENEPINPFAKVAYQDYLASGGKKSYKQISEVVNRVISPGKIKSVMPTRQELKNPDLLDNWDTVGDMSEDQRNQYFENTQSGWEKSWRATKQLTVGALSGALTTPSAFIRSIEGLGKGLANADWDGVQEKDENAGGVFQSIFKETGKAMEDDAVLNALGEWNANTQAANQIYGDGFGNATARFVGSAGTTIGMILPMLVTRGQSLVGSVTGQTARASRLLAATTTAGKIGGALADAGFLGAELLQAPSTILGGVFGQVGKGAANLYNKVAGASNVAKNSISTIAKVTNSSADDIIGLLSKGAGSVDDLVDDLVASGKVAPAQKEVIKSTLKQNASIAGGLEEVKALNRVAGAKDFMARIGAGLGSATGEAALETVGYIQNDAYNTAYRNRLKQKVQAGEINLTEQEIDEYGLNYLGQFLNENDLAQVKDAVHESAGALFAMNTAIVTAGNVLGTWNVLANKGRYFNKANMVDKFKRLADGSLAARKTIGGEMFKEYVAGNWDEGLEEVLQGWATDIAGTMKDNKVSQRDNLSEYNTLGNLFTSAIDTGGRLVSKDALEEGFVGVLQSALLGAIGLSGSGRNAVKMYNEVSKEIQSDQSQADRVNQMVKGDSKQLAKLFLGGGSQDMQSKSAVSWNRVKRMSEAKNLHDDILNQEFVNGFDINDIMDQTTISDLMHASAIGETKDIVNTLEQFQKLSLDEKRAVAKEASGLSDDVVNQMTEKNFEDIHKKQIDQIQKIDAYFAKQKTSTVGKFAQDITQPIIDFVNGTAYVDANAVSEGLFNYELNSLSKEERSALTQSDIEKMRENSYNKGNNIAVGLLANSIFQTDNLEAAAESAWNIHQVTSSQDGQGLFSFTQNDQSKQTSIFTELHDIPMYSVDGKVNKNAFKEAFKEKYQFLEGDQMLKLVQELQDKAILYRADVSNRLLDIQNNDLLSEEEKAKLRNQAISAEQLQDSISQFTGYMQRAALYQQRIEQAATGLNNYIKNPNSGVLNKIKQLFTGKEKLWNEQQAYEYVKDYYEKQSNLDAKIKAVEANNTLTPSQKLDRVQDLNTQKDQLKKDYDSFIGSDKVLQDALENPNSNNGRKIAVILKDRQYQSYMKAKAELLNAQRSVIESDFKIKSGDTSVTQDSHKNLVDNYIKAIEDFDTISLRLKGQTFANVLSYENRTYLDADFAKLTEYGYENLDTVYDDESNPILASIVKSIKDKFNFERLNNRIKTATSVAMNKTAQSILAIANKTHRQSVTDRTSENSIFQKEIKDALSGALDVKAWIEEQMNFLIEGSKDQELLEFLQYDIDVNIPSELKSLEDEAVKLEKKYYENESSIRTATSKKTENLITLQNEYDEKLKVNRSVLNARKLELQEAQNSSAKKSVQNQKEKNIAASNAKISALELEIAKIESEIRDLEIDLKKQIREISDEYTLNREELKSSASIIKERIKENTKEIAKKEKELKEKKLKVKELSEKIQSFFKNDMPFELSYNDSYKVNQVALGNLFVFEVEITDSNGKPKSKHLVRKKTATVSIEGIKELINDPSSLEVISDSYKIVRIGDTVIDGNSYDNNVVILEIKDNKGKPISDSIITFDSLHKDGLKREKLLSSNSDSNSYLTKSIAIVNGEVYYSEIENFMTESGILDQSDFNLISSGILFNMNKQVPLSLVKASNNTYFLVNQYGDVLKELKSDKKLSEVVSDLEKDFQLLKKVRSNTSKVRQTKFQVDLMKTKNALELSIPKEVIDISDNLMEVILRFRGLFNSYNKRDMVGLRYLVQNLNAIVQDLETNDKYLSYNSNLIINELKRFVNNLQVSTTEEIIKDEYGDEVSTEVPVLMSNGKDFSYIESLYNNFESIIKSDTVLNNSLVDTEYKKKAVSMIQSVLDFSAKYGLDNKSIEEVNKLKSQLPIDLRLKFNDLVNENPFFMKTSSTILDNYVYTGLKMDFDETMDKVKISFNPKLTDNMAEFVVLKKAIEDAEAEKDPKIKESKQNEAADKMSEFIKRSSALYQDVKSFVNKLSKYHESVFLGNDAELEFEYEQYIGDMLKFIELYNSFSSDEKNEEASTQQNTANATIGIILNELGIQSDINDRPDGILSALETLFEQDINRTFSAQGDKNSNSIVLGASNVSTYSGKNISHAYKYAPNVYGGYITSDPYFKSVQQSIVSLIKRYKNSYPTDTNYKERIGQRINEFTFLYRKMLENNPNASPTVQQRMALLLDFLVNDPKIKSDLGVPNMSISDGVAGSGKSYLIAMKIKMQLLEYPSKKVLLVGTLMQNLEKIKSIAGLTDEESSRVVIIENNEEKTIKELGVDPTEYSSVVVDEYFKVYRRSAALFINETDTNEMKEKLKEVKDDFSHLSVFISGDLTQETKDKAPFKAYFSDEVSYEKLLGSEFVFYNPTVLPFLSFSRRTSDPSIRSFLNMVKGPSSGTMVNADGSSKKDQVFNPYEFQLQKQGTNQANFSEFLVDNTFKYRTVLLNENNVLSSGVKVVKHSGSPATSIVSEAQNLLNAHTSSKVMIFSVDPTTIDMIKTNLGQYIADGRVILFETLEATGQGLEEDYVIIDNSSIPYDGFKTEVTATRNSKDPMRYYVRASRAVKGLVLVGEKISSVYDTGKKDSSGKIIHSTMNIVLQDSDIDSSPELSVKENDVRDDNRNYELKWSGSSVQVVKQKESEPVTSADSNLNPTPTFKEEFNASTTEQELLKAQFNHGLTDKEVVEELTKIEGTTNEQDVKDNAKSLKQSVLDRLQLADSLENIEDEGQDDFDTETLKKDNGVDVLNPISEEDVQSTTKEKSTINTTDRPSITYIDEIGQQSIFQLYSSFWSSKKELEFNKSIDVFDVAIIKDGVSEQIYIQLESNGKYFLIAGTLIIGIHPEVFNSYSEIKESYNDVSQLGPQKIRFDKQRYYYDYNNPSKTWVLNKQPGKNINKSEVFKIQFSESQAKIQTVGQLSGHVKVETDNGDFVLLERKHINAFEVDPNSGDMIYQDGLTTISKSNAALFTIHNVLSKSTKQLIHEFSGTFEEYNQAMSNGVQSALEDGKSVFFERYGDGSQNEEFKKLYDDKKFQDRLKFVGYELAGDASKRRQYFRYEGTNIFLKVDYGFATGKVNRLDWFYFTPDSSELLTQLKDKNTRNYIDSKDAQEKLNFNVFHTVAIPRGTKDLPTVGHESINNEEQGSIFTDFDDSFLQSIKPRIGKASDGNYYGLYKHINKFDLLIRELAKSNEYIFVGGDSKTGKKVQIRLNTPAFSYTGLSEQDFNSFKLLAEELKKINPQVYFYPNITRNKKGEIPSLKKDASTSVKMLMKKAFIFPTVEHYDSYFVIEGMNSINSDGTVSSTSPTQGNFDTYDISQGEDEKGPKDGEYVKCNIASVGKNTGGLYNTTNPKGGEVFEKPSEGQTPSAPLEEVTGGSYNANANANNEVKKAGQKRGGFLNPENT